MDGRFSIFTDGSKTETGISCDVFSDDLNISVSIRLPHTCTVFQAGIYAIDWEIELFSLCPSVIDIYVDRLTIIKALNNSY